MNKDNAKDYLPLVQALAEGKVIQEMWDTGDWRDNLKPIFSRPPKYYRIKPEPKVIWVNEYGDDLDGWAIHPNKEKAEASAVPGVTRIAARYVEQPE